MVAKLRKYKYNVAITTRPNFALSHMATTTSGPAEIDSNTTQSLKSKSLLSLKTEILSLNQKREAHFDDDFDFLKKDL